MEGAVLLLQRQHDLAVSQAWHAESFARTKRLKPLSAYQSGERERSKGAGGVALLNYALELQAQGKFVKIEKLK